jgi:carbon monoxide dehydrogenase subunit G
LVTERFEQAIRVSAPAARAWDLLTDVEQVASWITILEEVRELDHLAHYQAVLRDRVGPFKLRADLEIIVSEVTPGAAISFAAAGEDRQIGSRLAVSARMVLNRDTEGKTSVTVSGSYEVVGRVATLGAGAIRKKADTILSQFFGNAERELSG